MKAGRKKGPLRFAATILAAALSTGCVGTSNRAATYKNGVDDGYTLGAADEVKRLYWSRQEMEAPSGPPGRVEYYFWDEPEIAADGRRLAPERVGVPVFVPAPLGSGGR